MLLARGELRADEAAVAAMAGVPWHDLNKQYRRDYEAAVAHVLRRAGGRTAATRRSWSARSPPCWSSSRALDLQRAGRGRRPPAAKG